MNDFMREAIDQAKEGLREGGIPFGAVLARGDEIIATGRNQRMQRGDILMHAEIDCLRKVGGFDQVKGSVLYATFMPCHMCAGAVFLLGIEKVIVGETATPLAAASAELKAHGVEVIDLDLEECKLLLGEYIKNHPDVFPAHLLGRDE